MSSDAPVRLHDTASWAGWIIQLQSYAQGLNVWQYVDPDGAVLQERTDLPPEEFTTTEEYQEWLYEQRKQRHQRALKQWEATPEDQRGEKPAEPKRPTAEEAEREFNFQIKQYARVQDHYSKAEAQIAKVIKWIERTVEGRLLAAARTQTNMRKETSVRALVIALKRMLAPSTESVESALREEYNRLLSRARHGGVNPKKWIDEWIEVYSRATAYGIPEVSGSLAVRNFLNAVRVRIAPDWASSELRNVVRDELNSVRTLTLEQYGRWLMALIDENNAQVQSRAPSLFATLGSTPDPNDNNKKSSKSNGRVRHQCPCRPDGKHPWKPDQCLFIKAAVTGEPNRNARISKEEAEKILERLKEPRWKALRDAIERKGWTRQAAEGSGTNFPGTVSAAVIDPKLMGELGNWGVFSTIDWSRHPYSNSTLVDNCGALHVVNNKDLFEPGTFRKAGDSDMVYAGTASFPIGGYGRRVMRKVLDGKNGSNTEDLVLEDVALIEGFHVNIVSEARLGKAGIWYLGLDCSLRYGTLQKNVKVKQLKRVHNLVFLEYKPLSPCSSFPSCVPVSAAGTVMIEAIIRRGFRRWRSSADPPRPREDTEDLWHARAGHLGAEALRALVHNARNVKIKGTARVKCESCALTHAGQQISRRTSENRSTRPFWRVSWDIFDFPTSFDGMNWLLVIKDEYSGKLFPFPLVQKSHAEVFNAVRGFERWVRRQYGLSICKIRHDNDRAVIPPSGESAYQLWAHDEGIDLELTPSYTHEPNGGAERAGQELINKALKMRLGARLPEKLWSEIVRAAAFLHSISPSHVLRFRSPNEVLASWFKNYFRWYAPSISHALTADLRPDWSGIYAYGCRAYPLKKDREANRMRRDFKVQPRGHIGYLVGYRASNIYRIWVPELDRVITTRNVTFDEQTFFDPKREELERQPVEITRREADLLHEEEDERDAVSVLQRLLALDEPIEESITVAVHPPERESSPESQDESSRAVSEAPSDQGQGSGVTSEREGALPDPGKPLEDPLGAEMGGLPTPPEGTPEPPGELQSAPPVRDTREGTASEELGSRGSVSDEDENFVSAGSGAEEELPPTVDSPSSEQGSPPAEQHEASQEPQSDSAPREHTMQAPDPVPQQQPAPTSRQRRARATAEHPPVPTRRSARLRERRQREQEEAQGSQGMIHFVGDARRRAWESFCWTFLSGQQEPQSSHLTMHSVFAAAVQQRGAQRLGAAPSRPRIHRDNLVRVPTSWRELEKHPLGEQFKEAARNEVDNLIKKKTWRVIPREQAKSIPLPLKWVFTYKFDADGFLEKCKARICVRGDLQDTSSLQSTYAATLAARSFRTMMAIAAYWDLEIKQFDVAQAFLNARRDGQEPVACQLPEGFKQPGMCVELERALYGLRDSPLLWYREFSATLAELGLKPSAEEPCLFLDPERRVVVIFYVDDFLVLYHRLHSARAQRLIEGIKAKYEVHDQGDVEWFLGIRVIRDRAARKIWLCHDQYIEKIAKRYELTDVSEFPSIPLPTKELRKFEGQATPEQVRKYQELVGSLLYTAVMIRADVAFAASKLSQFLTNPGPEHLAAVKHAIRYAYGTRFLSIQYGGELPAGAQVLHISGDAAFADDPETRRSSQAFVISLFGGLINWKASRQETVTTSSTEAELYALSLTGGETMALQRLFRDLALDLGEPWRIFCDNQQTIRLVVGENERISTRLRHVDVHNLWLRQEHAKGSFEVVYLPTSQMPADGLTKALPRQRFEHFRALLNLQDVSHLVRKEAQGREGSATKA